MDVFWEPKWDNELSQAEHDFIEEGSKYSATDIMDLCRGIQDGDAFETSTRFQNMSRGLQRLPDSTRPLLHLMGVTRTLVWYEVFLFIVCFLVSSLGSSRLAQVIVCISFLILLNIKLRAIRIMLSGPAILGRAHLENFLEGENFRMFGLELPVRRYLALTVIYLPNFAESAFTAIALPSAIRVSPDTAIPLAFVAVFSVIVSLAGSLQFLALSRHWLMAHIGDILGGWSTDQSLNNVWYFLAMSASSSGLMTIAACGEKMMDVTIQSERQLVYRCMMHSSWDVTRRVWLKGFMTGGPRLVLKILVFRGMSDASMLSQLNILAAIALGLFTWTQLLYKSLRRVMAHSKRLKELKQQYKRFKPNVVFLNPFSNQIIHFRGQRHILGEGAAYSFVFMTVGLICYLWMLVPPVQKRMNGSSDIRAFVSNYF